MEIIKIIRDYISSTHTDGALLINGEWGIGKSYFLREKIITDIEKQENQKTKKKFKCLYVSLNGLTDAKQISSLVAYEKMMGGKSGKWKPGRALGGLILAAAGSIPILKPFTPSKNALKEVNWEDLLDFENNVLCFDDLERNSIQESIFGFINNHFVESTGVKTIIIGNESEIGNAPGEKGNANYLRIKEKLIFRTIQFGKENVPWKELILRYKHDRNFYGFLEKYGAYISEALKAYQIWNLRTIIFFADILEAVFGSRQLSQEEDLPESIILMSLLIANEFKAGLLVSTDHNNFKSLNLLTSKEYEVILIGRLINKPGQSASTSYELVFYDKYGLNKTRHFYFFGSVYNYILTGYLDHKLLSKDIEQFIAYKKEKRKADRPEMVAFKNLQNAYWAESDEALNSFKEQFLKFLANGDYAFYEYGVFFNTIRNFSQKGIFTEEPDHLRGLVIAGCMKAMKKWQGELYMISHIEETVFVSDDNELKDIIQAGIRNLQAKQQESKLDDFFKEIGGDWGKFRSRFEVFDPFDYSKPAEFLERLDREGLPALRHFTAFLEELSKIVNIQATFGKHAAEFEELRRLYEGKRDSEKSALKRMIWKAGEGTLKKFVDLN